MFNWSDSSTIEIFACACSVTVLTMMMFMAVRLYQSYRRHLVYRLLIIIIPIAMIQQLLQLSGAGSSSPLLQLSTRLLGILSFIIINFVFMKLYSRPTARMKLLPFILMLAAALVIAGVELVFNLQLLTPSLSLTTPLVALDFYGILVTFLILLDTRGVEIRAKYSLSLIVYFAADLSGLTDRYVFQGNQPVLLIFTHLLPVVYFLLLFLLLFDWVIDRLLTTYRFSITDGLTGLYNRKHFQRKAEQLLRRGKTIAIIFCDIDNFKKLNDTQGHHRADEVLKQVSEMMRELSQGIGAAGRYGGEELLMVVSSKDKPAELAELLRKRVEQESIVTVSVGVSYSRSDSTVEQIVKEADEAMYRSKTTGKNRVTVINAPASARGRSAKAK